MRGRFPLILLVLAFMTVSASPARAADGFGVSSDGIDWGRAVTKPLFAEQMLWVPGDEATGTFYVRNRDDGPAELTVDVISTDTGALMDTGDLHISAVGGGEWATVSEPGTHRLLTSPNLEAGSVTPVRVNVSFAAESGNISQLRSTELSFRVTLSASPSEGQADVQPGGWLPDTGVNNVFWFVILAAVLIGTGSALVAWRESREEALHD